MRNVGGEQHRNWRHRAVASSSELTKARLLGGTLTGKVFISCGQAEPNERAAAASVRDLLKKEFNLDSYLAIYVQNLDDIMIITNELRSSDYFLFVDFNRCSLFTHQELALAHHLRFGGNIIALRQKGAGDLRADPESLDL